MTVLTDIQSDIATMLPSGKPGGLKALDIRNQQNALATDLYNLAIVGGGISITGTGDPGLTRAQAKLTSFASPPNAMRTIGYDDIYDEGGGLHVKVPTQPLHKGWFQSAAPNATYYELMPENGALTLPQFGAKRMDSYTTQPGIDSAQDCYRAFRDADEYMTYRCADLIVPGGPWYLGHPVSFSRASYRIIFVPTAFIRTPAYSSAFVTQHGYGVDIDYTMITTSQNTNKGQGYFKPTGAPGAGNCYRCIVAGTTTGTDNILVGAANNPAATYTWGTTQFKFEKYVGPGSIYDYDITTPRGGNTVMEFVNPHIWSFWKSGSTVGDGLFPDETPDASGEPVYNSAIILRARAIVRNPHITQFPGFGIAAVADGDYYLKGAGNVNGFYIEHLRAYSCGKAGWHVGVADSNAGVITYADTGFCGRAGLECDDLLGNNYLGHQSAFDGKFGAAIKQYPSQVTYNGKAFRVRVPQNGFETLPQGYPHAFFGQEPGNPNNLAWQEDYGNGTLGIGAQFTGSISGTTLSVSAVASGAIAVNNMICSKFPAASNSVIAGTKIISGSGSTWTVSNNHATPVTSQAMKAMLLNNSQGSEWPDWSVTQKYEWGAAFTSSNGNACNLFLGMYVEGGTPAAQINGRSVVFGGPNLVDTSHGGLQYYSEQGAWAAMSVLAPIYFPSAGKKFLRVDFGRIDNTHPLIFWATNFDDQRYALRFETGDGIDGLDNTTMVLDNYNVGPASRPLFEITLATASKAFGRTQPLKEAFKPNNFLLSDRQLIARQGRYYSIGGGPPSAGEMQWTRGDVIMNANISSGQPMGWGCSVSGDPGTWVAMANYA